MTSQTIWRERNVLAELSHGMRYTLKTCTLPENDHRMTLKLNPYYSAFFSWFIFTIAFLQRFQIHVNDTWSRGVLINNWFTRAVQTVHKVVLYSGKEALWKLKHSNYWRCCPVYYWNKTVSKVAGYYQCKHCCLVIENIEIVTFSKFVLYLDTNSGIPLLIFFSVNGHYNTIYKLVLWQGPFLCGFWINL